LASWKKQYLSKGERVTLTKSTLSSLPYYFLFLFPLPVEITNRLEKLERDFLWGGLGDEFEYQHVNWKTMFASIQDGGRRLLILNLVLLGKWLWPYLEEKDHLWRKLVIKKYGISWGQRHMNEVWGPYGVCLSKYTRRVWWGGWVS
jgi:hypothetical protein